MFSGKLMADMSLIGPLNSKFWWDLYIFANLAVHSHLMPRISSSKLIRISDFVRQPGKNGNNIPRTLKCKKKNYCRCAVADIAWQNDLAQGSRINKCLLFEEFGWNSESMHTELWTILLRTYTHVCCLFVFSGIRNNLYLFFFPHVPVSILRNLFPWFCA